MNSIGALLNRLLMTHLRSPSQVQERLDRLISIIKKIQEPFMHGGSAADVLIVAHGHILRAFTKRWMGESVQDSVLDRGLTVGSSMGYEISFHYDDGAWRDRSSQLRTPQSC